MALPAPLRPALLPPPQAFLPPPPRTLLPLPLLPLAPLALARLALALARLALARALLALALLAPLAQALRLSLPDLIPPPPVLPLWSCLAKCPSWRPSCCGPRGATTA
jgi:hypothetical protein